MKNLQNKEATIDSTKKREILMHVYPAAALQQSDPFVPATNSNNRWIFDLAIPRSTIPSTLRDGTKQILPNWYESKIKIINLQPGRNSVQNQIDLHRSSSFPAIGIAKRKQREIQTKHIVTNKIKALAATSIINQINQAIANTASNNSINQRLLSQIIPAQLQHPILINTFFNLPINWITPYGPMNERDQFVETQLGFKNQGQIQFNAAEIEEIIRSINSNDPNLIMHLKQRLNACNIKCEPIFHNFASSGGRHFSQGGIIGSSYQQTVNATAQHKIFNLLNYKFNRWIQKTFHLSPGSKKPPKIKEIKEIQAKWNTMKTGTNIVDLANYQQIMPLYLRYLKLLNTYAKNKDENLLMQVITILLAKKLNLPVHITCKSGEDRTGAIVVAIIASCNLLTADLLANLDQDNVWNDFKQKFWQIFPKNMELSTSHEITGINASGAKGLQSQHNNTPVSHAHFIQQSNKFARIHKAPFNAVKLTSKKFVQINQNFQLELKQQTLHPTSIAYHK